MVKTTNIMLSEKNWSCFRSVSVQTTSTYKSTETKIRWVTSTTNWVSQVVLVVKNTSACTGDTEIQEAEKTRGSIPSSGRSPRGDHGHPFQSCLENPMDRKVWQAAVHRVEKIWTQLKRLSTQHLLVCSNITYYWYCEERERWDWY